MRKLAILAFVILGAHATASLAANTAFLNQSILTKIPKAQTADFSAAVGDALNNVADGQSASWTSKPARRTQPVINATFHPQETVKTSKGQTCRMLVTDMERGGEKENWKFWFCQQENGTWRASNQ